MGPILDDLQFLENTAPQVISSDGALGYYRPISIGYYADATGACDGTLTASLSHSNDHTSTGVASRGWRDANSGHPHHGRGTLGPLYHG